MPIISKDKLQKPFRSRPLKIKKPTAKHQQTVPDVVQADAAGRLVWGQTTKGRTCELPKDRTELRKCHVQIALIGDREAKKQKVEPGVYLRLCSKPKTPGKLIAVQNHKEALELSRSYCRCIVGGSTRDKCARDVGLSPKKRRRR